MGNFFRELFSAERCILADPFIGHDDASYRPETKAVLVRLIQSVVSGRYFPQSEASRYVCKIFRLGASELTKHYNATNDVSKEVSTFRCQISLASEKLSHKVLLTVDEANRLFGLGICSLRERMRESKCPFVIKVGEKKQLIDREKLEKYVHEHRRF